MNVHVFIFLALIDRATKGWALSTLAPASEPAFFSLALYFNSGISFSLLEAHPGISTAVALAGAGIFGLLCLRTRFAHMPGIAFLWAGALGNLMDRIVYGHVIDWIYVGGYINLADIWLCIGCLLIFVRCLQSEIS
ncbi:MAG: signal peptidase II [Synergistaceae bacterium]|jgi:signal peptidase II|nr:signal peptidase II [Synergistaceae bacterium]